MTSLSKHLHNNKNHNTNEITLAPPLPAVPRCGEVTIRTATVDDLPFVDRLQKMHSHMVGFLQRGALRSYLENERVIVAEDGAGVSLGYCISRDEYMNRDDVGIIYQLNVLPLQHRNLIGATLVRHVFEHAAYGCRLFSCWCAQDIRANYFWEALGFLPIAFRTGSEAKQRTHIFWQRRIREGDETTPYWFPKETRGGGVREGRICLPIPPDTHWLEAKPVILPSLPEPVKQEEAAEGEDPLARMVLPGGQPVRPRAAQPMMSPEERAAKIRASTKHLGGAPKGQKAIVRGGRVKYVERNDMDDAVDAFVQKQLAEPKQAKAPGKPKRQNDKKFLAAARNIRDRYLEQMNDPANGFILPPACEGKWDVSRRMEGTGMECRHPRKVTCTTGTVDDLRALPMVVDEQREAA